jgi:hypothetical protein
MKNIKVLIVIALLGIISIVACKKETIDTTETETIDFEELPTGVQGFWNGSDLSGNFSTANMTFENQYSAQYSSWQGFSYAQKADVVTSGFDNLYSVFDEDNGTNKFAIYYQPYSGDAFASFTPGMEYQLRSLKVCNATYAALSMKNGDSFAKKFGGDSGNDKDWFKMTIIGYNAAGDSVHSVDFYLADYRFDDNSKDYIVNKWTTVDLTALGKVNKITFRFSSTDMGLYGMNTPAIACLDDLVFESHLPIQ